MNTKFEPVIFNFNQLNSNQIMIVNDSVMGGRSESKFESTDKSVKFNGNVSLKNNGGFASLRMLWPFQETNGYKNIQLKIKGDGKSYQFRLRTNRGFDGAAYVYEFETVKDKTIVVNLELDKFVPSFRGRTLRNMPQLQLSDVQQMGILIADKQVGSFSVELESILLINP